MSLPSSETRIRNIFAHWRELDSWAARQILKRLDRGYQRFFSRIAKRPPKFRSWRKPYSFTMAPSGYGFYGDRVRLMKKKHGKAVYLIDRFEATTKTCSICGRPQLLMDLNVREWRCPSCKTHHQRDVNAAINVLKVGASTFGLEGISLAIASPPQTSPEVGTPQSAQKSIGSPENPTALAGGVCQVWYTYINAIVT